MAQRRKRRKKDAAIPQGLSLLRTLEAFPRSVAPEGSTLSHAASLAVTLDGRSVISGSYENTVWVSELSSGRLLRNLEGHSGIVGSVAGTPDGRFVVSGSDDDTVMVWELESGRLLRTLNGHSGSVYSVAVTPDGRVVVSGSSDKTVIVWELESGRRLKTLEGHSGAVASVGITRDGRWIVSASHDRTIRLWDAPTGRPLRTLEGHTDNVDGLALYGHVAATHSVDQTGPALGPCHRCRTGDPTRSGPTSSLLQSCRIYS